MALLVPALLLVVAVGVLAQALAVGVLVSVGAAAVLLVVPLPALEALLGPVVPPGSLEPGPVTIEGAVMELLLTLPALVGSWLRSAQAWSTPANRSRRAPWIQASSS